jgi:hypothetical protein
VGKPAENELKTQDLRAWASALSEQIGALRAELRRCQAELAAAEERQALVHRLLELDGDTTPESICNEDSHDTQPSAEPETSHLGNGHALASRPSGQSLEDAVASILERSGEPMHVGEIRLRLIADGVRIPGRGDDANIIVKLRAAPERFTRTARGTYALASWGLPSLDSKPTLKGRRSRTRR